ALSSDAVPISQARPSIVKRNGTPQRSLRFDPIGRESAHGRLVKDLLGQALVHPSDLGDHCVQCPSIAWKASSAQMRPRTPKSKQLPPPTADAQDEGARRLTRRRLFAAGAGAAAAIVSRLMLAQERDNLPPSVPEWQLEPVKRR